MSRWFPELDVDEDDDVHQVGDEHGDRALDPYGAGGMYDPRGRR
jgi:hypothetical protein